jgi:hypothetical protein
MNKTTVRILVSTFILGIGIFVSYFFYIQHKNIETTKLICRIIQECYDGSMLKDKEIGFRVGPDGLEHHLIIGEQKRFKLYRTKAFHWNGVICDVWGNGIVVVKTSNGFRVISKGPDGLSDSTDDVISE